MDFCQIFSLNVNLGKAHPKESLLATKTVEKGQKDPRSLLCVGSKILTLANKNGPMAVIYQLDVFCLEK